MIKGYDMECFKMVSNDDNVACVEWIQGSGIATTEILAGRNRCEPTHLRSTRSRDTSITWQDPDMGLLSHHGLTLGGLTLGIRMILR